MKIYNLHTKDTREVKEIKVTSYEEYDKFGKLRNNEYVQFIVIGKNDRTWVDCMTVKEFKKYNPKVSVKGLS